jgi:transcriptional regulator with XRE-family HTH domain
MLNVQLVESLRLSQGYSQEALSEKMGYTHSVYGKKVRCVRKFTIEDIAKLCKIFNVEPNDLIDIQ